MLPTDVRLRVLENIGDPDGDNFQEGGDKERLNRLIKDVHDELSTVAVSAYPALMNKTVYDTVTGAAAVDGRNRDQEMELPADFHKLTHVQRTDTTPPRPVTIVLIQRIDFYRSIDIGDYGYLRHDAQTDLSRIKEDPLISGGRDFVGIIEPASGTTYKYAIFYVARRLFSDSFETFVLPEEYHYLIVLGVTVRALGQEHSDAAEFKRLYDEGRAAMIADLASREG